MFACSDCNAGPWELETSLKAHRKEAHAIIDGLWKCSHCGLVYKKRGPWKAHLINIHNEPDDRPFRCKVCNKNFETQQGYIRHLRDRHPDGVKKALYSCPNCNKAYSYRESLASHLRQKHPKDDLHLVTGQHEQYKPPQHGQSEHGNPVLVEEAGTVQLALPAQPSLPATSSNSMNLASGHPIMPNSFDALNAIDSGKPEDPPALHVALESQDKGVTLDDTAERHQNTPRSPELSAVAPVLQMSSSLENKKRKLADSPQSVSSTSKKLLRNGSAEHQIVTDGLQKAYEKVLGDTLQDNIRLKQENVILKHEIEELKKKINDFKAQDDGEKITNIVETEIDDEGAQADDKKRPSTLEIEKGNEKMRIKSERESSLSLLNSESASLRAQTEMPGAQNDSLVAQNRVMQPIVGNEQGMNQFYVAQGIGFPQFWHPQSSPFWFSPHLHGRN